MNFEANIDLDALKKQFLGKIYVNKERGKPEPANLNGKLVNRSF